MNNSWLFKREVYWWILNRYLNYSGAFDFCQHGSPSLSVIFGILILLNDVVKKRDNVEIILKFQKNMIST